MTVSDIPDLRALEPWAVTFPSAGRELAGYLFAPEGSGRLPALIVNHGSGGLAPRMRPVAEALNRMGYVAFLPIRRGYNGNPGPHWRSLVMAPEGSPERGRQLVDTLSAENDDVLAALAWLEGHERVEADQIGIMGISFGGIMTTLAIGRSPRFKAAVNFAGAAMNWEQAPALRETMLEAVRRTQTPLFLIQAQNDFSLGPTYDLGAELARLGKPHEARIYPPNGTTREDGHAFITADVPAWSADVGRFLTRWMGTSSAPRP